jgi:hypothetical protein
MYLKLPLGSPAPVLILALGDWTRQPHEGNYDGLWANIESLKLWLRRSETLSYLEVVIRVRLKNVG